MRRAAEAALKSRLSKRKLQQEQATQDGRGKGSQLEQDFLVCEGLEAFCEGFSKSIEQLLPLLQEFWQIVQSLDQDWFSEDNGLLDTHIWALRMGLTATAPKVHQQLQVSMKSCSRVAKKFQELEEAMQVRNTHWVEKEHYKRKLQEMREELSRQDRGGKQVSQQQLETLARNEEKHQKAQDGYESFQTTAHAAAEARSELKRTLRDAVRTVTCGWFIATGAGVCSAVGRAETMAGKASQASQSVSGPHALPSSAPSDGGAPTVAACQSSARAAGEAEEMAEEFDPRDPFKAEWTCEELAGSGQSDAAPEESSPGGAAPTVGRPAASQSPASASGTPSSCQPGSESPLDSFSMDELREMLEAAGLEAPDARGGSEARRQMQALLMQSQSQGFAPPPRQ